MQCPVTLFMAPVYEKCGS